MDILWICLRMDRLGSVLHCCGPRKVYCGNGLILNHWYIDVWDALINVVLALMPNAVQRQWSPYDLDECWTTDVLVGLSVWMVKWSGAPIAIGGRGALILWGPISPC